MVWAGDFDADLHGQDNPLIGKFTTVRFGRSAAKDKEFQRARKIRCGLLTSLITEFQMMPLNTWKQVGQIWTHRLAMKLNFGQIDFVMVSVEQLAWHKCGVYHGCKKLLKSDHQPIVADFRWHNFDLKHVVPNSRKSMKGWKPVEADLFRQQVFKACDPLSSEFLEKPDFLSEDLAAEKIDDWQNKIAETAVRMQHSTCSSRKRMALQKSPEHKAAWRKWDEAKTKDEKREAQKELRPHIRKRKFLQRCQKAPPSLSMMSFEGTSNVDDMAPILHQKCEEKYDEKGRSHKNNLLEQKL